MKYQYNDGGRSAFFDTPGNNDCVTRALAIATGLTYLEVWDGVTATGTRNPSGRVRTQCAEFTAFAKSLGLQFVSTMRVLKEIKFPPRAVACINGHYVAIVDGVMHDTYNPSPAGNKHCFGYWTPKENAPTLFNVVSTATSRPLNRAPLNAEAAANMQRLLWLNYRKQTIIEPHG